MIYLSLYGFSPVEWKTVWYALVSTKKSLLISYEAVCLYFKQQATLVLSSSILRST